MSAPLVRPEQKAALQQELLRWFRTAKRDLPWRKTRDPYAIWLSEVMLQQTQVATVIPYWEKFLKAFPTVRHLAEAPLEQVLSLWQGLGYYSRARLLHRAAQLLWTQHGGRLPDDVEALRALPGFGRYTAGAVASIAFGKKAPILDGNVDRVFSRFFVVEGAGGDKAREKTLWALAEQVVPEEHPGDFNQALMELGALVCRKERPTCLLCPLNQACGALREGRVEELPKPKVRPEKKTLSLAVAVWTKKDALLLARRREGGLFGGLWELPCAEFQAGQEGPRAIADSLHPSWTSEKAFAVVERTLTHRELKLHLHRVKNGRLPRQHPLYEEFRFVSQGELPALGMSTAMRHALKEVWKKPEKPRRPAKAVSGGPGRRAIGPKSARRP